MSAREVLHTWNRRVPSGRMAERVELATDAYQGNSYVDLRIFVEIEGEWRPTKRGATIPIRELDAVIAALGGVHR